MDFLSSPRSNLCSPQQISTANFGQLLPIQRPPIAPREITTSWCWSLQRPSLRRTGKKKYRKRIPLNILPMDSHRGWWEGGGSIYPSASPSCSSFAPLSLSLHPLEPLFGDGRFIVPRYGSLSAQLWQQYRTKDGAFVLEIAFCTHRLIDSRVRDFFSPACNTCAAGMPINRFMAKQGRVIFMPHICALEQPYFFVARNWEGHSGGENHALSIVLDWVFRLGLFACLEGNFFLTV